MALNIPCLTKHQEAVLTRLATGQVTRYAAVTGVESDGDVRKVVDNMFAEDMQLVEWGLLYDITSQPKWKEKAASILEEEGRTLRVLSATPMVNMMFGGVAWSGIN